MPHQTIVETAKQALSEIAHPYLGRDVMALDMVRNINFSDGIAHLTLELSSPACPARDTLTGSIKQCLSQLPDIAEVQLEVTARVRSNQAEAGSMSTEPDNRRRRLRAGHRCIFRA